MRGRRNQEKGASMIPVLEYEGVPLISHDAAVRGRHSDCGTNAELMLYLEFLRFQKDAVDMPPC